MKSITVIFEQNAVNTKELYHSVAATTGRQWSINKKVVAIWAIGTISLALLSPPAMGQDVPDARQAELTMLRSALKSRADEIAQLKAENAKLAEQVKRLVELCAKAGIALTDAAPATAPAAKPPATPPATAPAAKPVMTLAGVARVIQDAMAKDETHKTLLHTAAAFKGLKGRDVQGTMTVGRTSARGKNMTHVEGESPEIPYIEIIVSEADGLRVSKGKQVSFVGKIETSARREVAVRQPDPRILGTKYITVSYIMVKEARIVP
jgi:hypothetical protein